MSEDRYGHIASILQAMEAYLCDKCKTPVGKEGRGCKICVTCAGMPDDYEDEEET